MEERDRLIMFFTLSRSHRDLATLFISEEISVVDIMKYEITILDPKFYKKIFNTIASYIYDEIDKKRFHKGVMSVIDRLVLNRFTKESGCPSIDYLCGSLIGSIIRKLINSNNDDQLIGLLYRLDSNTNIDKSALVDLLLFDRRLLNKTTVSFLLTSGYISIRDIITIVMKSSDGDISYEGILNMLNEYAFNNNVYLYMLGELSEMLFVSTTDTETSFDINIRSDLRGKKKKIIDTILCGISRTIHDHSYLDITDFLISSISTHEDNKDTIRSHIYRKIYMFLTSDDYKNNHKSNFLITGNADDDLHLNEDEMRYILNDILMSAYVNEAKTLTPYEMFIRLFNINRFRFIRNGQMVTLNTIINECYINSPFPTTLALTEDINVLLNF